MLKLFDLHFPSDRAAVRLASRLALKGATFRGSYAPQVHATWRPYCDDPVPVVMRSHPRSDLPTVEAGLLAPCRKCKKCRLFRRMRWRQRIFNEVAQCDDAGRRSWFVTVTFSDLHLGGIYAEGRKLADVKGIPTEEAVERVAYGHLKRFHKRLRKRLSPRIAGYRFVCVTEYGSLNGRLHYHLVLHETAGVILYRDIATSWNAGFVNAKLVNCETAESMAGTATYLSKYVAKSLNGVRASISYGAVTHGVRGDERPPCLPHRRSRAEGGTESSSRQR